MLRLSRLLLQLKLLLLIILEQFVCRFGRVLQWDPILANGIGNQRLRQDKRQSYPVLFAQYVLGTLDSADDPYQYRFLDVPMGEATATFITTFFSRSLEGAVVSCNRRGGIAKFIAAPG